MILWIHAAPSLSALLCGMARATSPIHDIRRSLVLPAVVITTIAVTTTHALCDVWTYSEPKVCAHHMMSKHRNSSHNKNCHAMLKCPFLGQLSLSAFSLMFHCTATLSI